MKQTQINNSFATMLNELRAGAASDECSASLEEVIGAVRDTGKTGTLTLKLKFSPAGEEIETRYEIKLGKPERAKPATVFFVTDENRLVREDPNQSELALKTVEMPKGVIKEVPQAKAV